ncbi:hypothetical protein SUDANB145_01927 [Streptomyces sp. enrichment culture]|uniref:hypothetical protein n=1 Tax=Streptomyces sp. enrichment culture TaxID=1795815 RepID=UPI003F578E2B
MTSDVPAPPPGTPPTSPEEAVRIVRSRFAQPTAPDGSPAELSVHEFDLGYLVYPTPRPTEPGSGRPAAPAPPGGAKVVVSKEDGETVTVPNYPTEQAIALYRGIRGRGD